VFKIKIVQVKTINSEPAIFFGDLSGTGFLKVKK